MSPERASPLLVTVLGLALVAGVGATCVASAAGTPATVVPSASSFHLSSTEWGLLLLSPFGLVLGILAYRRLVTPERVHLPWTIFLPVLILLGALVAGVIVGHDLHLGVGPQLGSGSGTTHNGTSNQTNPNGTGSGSGGSGSGSGNGPSHPTAAKLDLGPVVFLALVVGAALLIAFIVVPGVAVRRHPTVRFPRSPADPAATAAARSALAGAQGDLAAGADPRTVIEQLYGRLLAQITPAVGDLSAHTPEEIRTEHLVRLGVRPDAAEALTRSFEEARYSSHPLGPASAERVRLAIAAAARDLARLPDRA